MATCRAVWTHPGSHSTKLPHQGVLQYLQVDPNEELRSVSTLAVRHATVINSTDAEPIIDGTVVAEDGKIVAVGPDAEVKTDAGTEELDATGRFVIPGLSDANVHLVAARTPDTLLDFEGRYEELALEAAEILLKYGFTTVFDTWGPPGPTTKARDLINAGDAIGARIYCAGNIIGLTGPLGPDFFDPGTTLEKETRDRINAVWEAGTGPGLARMTPDEIRDAISTYIETTGVDFIKFASTDHRHDGTFFRFSEAQQRAIVEAARAHGRRVQAHTTSVESLRIEAELGADLLQHGDITAGQPIGEELLDFIVKMKLPTAALIVTDEHLEWATSKFPGDFTDQRKIADVNQRNLIKRGARLLLTTDGFAYGPRIKNHPGFRAGTLKDDVPDLSVQLGLSHKFWVKGAFQRGMSPMEALRSATIYTAEAYGVADRVGSLEPGKSADLVVLASDPLKGWEAYGDVVDVVQGGNVVNRDALAKNLKLAVDPGQQ